MSSASSSAFFLFSEKDIKELKSQQVRLISQASSLAAAVSEAEEHLQQLKTKYAVSQECLQHLDSLITKASAERATVTRKSSDDKADVDFEKALAMVEENSTVATVTDDMEIPCIAPGNGKPHAPILIRKVLEMHFSDKVNMNTFFNEEYRCVVYFKDLPVVSLHIWYNTSGYLPTKGGRAVWCCGRQYIYTTMGELKNAITSAIEMATKPFKKNAYDPLEEDTDVEIPQVAPGNGKPHAPMLIRKVLEMHFSDKVNMDTFSNEELLCIVYLKDLPAVHLQIWYDAGYIAGNYQIGSRYKMPSGRIVCCAGRQYNYTTVGDLKNAITSMLALAAERF
jgi:hypothetical protein